PSTGSFAALPTTAANVHDSSDTHTSATPPDSERAETSTPALNCRSCVASRSTGRPESRRASRPSRGRRARRGSARRRTARAPGGTEPDATPPSGSCLGTPGAVHGPPRPRPLPCRLTKVSAVHFHHRRQERTLSIARDNNDFGARDDTQGANERHPARSRLTNRTTA